MTAAVDLANPGSLATGVSGKGDAVSPKKKSHRKPSRSRDTQRPASSAPVRTRREPVVAAEPPRWPVVLWTVLTAVWVGGSGLFFVLYLAEGFALLGTEEITLAARRTTAGYLAAMVVCALVVPLAGALTALHLRRKVAAGMFAAVLAVSVVAVWALAPPGEIAAAIWAAFTGS